MPDYIRWKESRMRIPAQNIAKALHALLEAYPGWVSIRDLADLDDTNKVRRILIDREFYTTELPDGTISFFGDGHGDLHISENRTLRALEGVVEPGSFLISYDTHGEYNQTRYSEIEMTIVAGTVIFPVDDTYNYPLRVETAP